MSLLARLSRKTTCGLILLALILSASCARTPKYEWTNFSSPDGAFTVSLPGKVEITHKATQSKTGGNFTSYSAATKASNRAAYGCAWWEDASLKGMSADEMLDHVRDSSMGKVVHESRLTVQGRPARELRVESAPNTAIDNRIILDGRKIYTLFVVNTERRRDEANIRRFFDSFQFK
jgi:hypothetical protein